MFRRVAAVAATAAVLLTLASACTGSPAPVESTTPALTEDEAFAAAEETYRAYVDALNQVDLSDPETFEPVYALTTGEANAGARESFSQMHADGWSVTGSSHADLVEPADYDGDVVLSICLNVADVEVIDSNGMSQVDADRVDVQSMRVTLTPNTSSGFTIRSIEGREGEPRCDVQ